jgi:hypothetical protein
MKPGKGPGPPLENGSSIGRIQIGSEGEMKSVQSLKAGEAEVEQKRKRTRGGKGS